MNSSTHNTARSRADVIELLRSHDITPTQQRVEIGQVLFGRAQHVTAELVMAMVNQGSEIVSKATVYNTLGLFASRSLIREVVIDPAKLVYDTNLHPHHHIYNVQTGMLEDVTAEDVKIEQLPKLPEGTALEGVDVIIRVRKDD